MVKVIVCGSRDFSGDRTFIADELNEIMLWLGECLRFSEDVEFVAGGARGVDTVAAEVLQTMGHRVKVMPADWERDGKAAGFLRNKRMLDYCMDAQWRWCVAFWDGKSVGTKDMVSKCLKNGFIVKIIRRDGCAKR